MPPCKQPVGAPSMQVRKLAFPNQHKTVVTETMAHRKPASDAFAADRTLNCSPPPPII